MHTIPNHVPIVVKQNSTMKQFTGQGVEKNNDAKRLLFQKSNKWNAARDVLHLELRQLALQGIFLSSPSCHLLACAYILAWNKNLQLLRDIVPRGYSQKGRVGVCRPLPQILTPLMTKVFNFCQPMYDLCGCYSYPNHN